MTTLIPLPKIGNICTHLRLCGFFRDHRSAFVIALVITITTLKPPPKIGNICTHLRSCGFFRDHRRAFAIALVTSTVTLMPPNMNVPSIYITSFSQILAELTERSLLSVNRCLNNSLSKVNCCIEDVADLLGVHSDHLPQSVKFG